MKFKRFRYNLIVIGLIAIICCCVAFPLVTGGSDDINQGEIIENPEEGGGDEGIIVPPEEDEEEEIEEDKFLYEKPADLINYAIDLLYNGEGFYSTYTQTVTNTTNVLGQSISVPQYAKGNIIRSNNLSLQEGYFWSTYTGIGSDQTKNCYQFYYIDKDNDKFIEGTTSSYNKDNMTYDLSKGSSSTMSYQDGMDKYFFLIGDGFPLVTSTKKGDIAYSDKIVEDSFDRTYREIKIIYNVNNVPQKMKDFYSTTGQLTDINYTDLTITYKINVDTGKIASMTRTEKMTAKNPQMGVTVSSTAITTQYFSSVDKAQTIVCPA